MFGLQPELDIEVPFTYRNMCWFCGEPGNQHFIFPNQHHLVIDCAHPKLSVPTCKECLVFANSANVDNIGQVHQVVKQLLFKTYRKDLAIGVNWTQEELATSQFEGGNFEGFQRSAWFMFEVAKQRVNFRHWPLVKNGIEIELYREKEPFTFDGVLYPCIDEAITHYTHVFDLPTTFFKQVLAKKGSDKFSEAVRFCRLYVGTTPQEQKKALQAL